MSKPEFSRAAWGYFGLVCLGGFVALLTSIIMLAQGSRSDVWWLALAAPLLLAGRIKIQIPKMDGRICPSGAIIIYAALAGGPALATILAAMEGLTTSLTQSKDLGKRVFFNVAALALSIFLASLMAGAVHVGAEGSFRQIIVQGITLTISYYVINMTVVLVMMLLTAGVESIAAARSALLWSWANFFTSGLVAVLLCLTSNNVPVVVAVSIAVVALSYLTLKHYFGVLREREDALSARKAALESQSQALAETGRLLGELHATHQASLKTLAFAIEAKDPLTHGHVHRVQELALRIGKRVAMAEDRLEALEQAAMLHDIGKLALPDYILYQGKPESPEDRRKYEKHARIGADILKHARLDESVIPIVEHHHESYDGSGFPLGLTGEQIPLGARIVAVADMYDMLRHPRREEENSRQQAAELLIRASGQGLDPALVDILVEDNCRILMEHELAINPASQAESIDSAPPETGFVNDFLASRIEAMALYELSEGLAEAVAPGVALQRFSGVLAEYIATEGILIFLPDRNHQNIEFAHGAGPLRHATDELEVLRRWITRRLQRKTALDNAEKPFYIPEKENPMRRLGDYSAMVLPFFLSPAERGALVLCTQSTDPINDDQLRLAVTLLDRTAPALVRARAHERTLREALLDGLTGLGNVRKLKEEGQPLITELLGKGAAGCVVMLDLNGFKAVNDTLGHHEGDRLLVEVAAILSHHTREGDLLIRNGGDEFVMVLPGVSPSVAAERMAIIHREVCGLWPSDWQHGVIGISAGLASFPREGSKLSSLLKLADRRMYDDKAARKATHAQGLPRNETPILNNPPPLYH